MFPECSNFIGTVCKQLKTLNPLCEISHAPQPPYFTSQFGNVYNLIYNKYKTYFDWFNIQYYNNGPSQSFEQIFIKSDSTVTPKTSILELINSGINASYLVMGKPVSGEANPSDGYVDLGILKTIVKQAYSTPVLENWKNQGGEMIWYYNTQNLKSSNNISLINYFSNI